MKNLILVLISMFAVNAFATPVCGTLSSVSVTGGNPSNNWIGSVTFVLAGQTFKPPVAYGATGNGAIDYADPAVTAGMVSLVSTAFVNHAAVCYDPVTMTLSFN